MLVLTRRVGEEIIVDGNIHIKVVSITGGKVRLGIDAPPHVRVDREEVVQRKMQEAPGRLLAAAVPS